MKIKDVLARKGGAIASVPGTATIAQAVDELATHDIGALVVRDPGGPLIGILSERDVVRRLQDRGADVLLTSVADVMTVHVVTCGPDDDLDTIMRVMTDRRIRHLPVMDGGALLGIVSIGDVVKNRIDELELTAEQLVSYINS